MDVDGPAHISTARKRLQAIDKELVHAKSISGAIAEGLVKALQAQQQELLQVIRSSQPHGQQMRSVLRQIEGLRARPGQSLFDVSVATALCQRKMVSGKSRK